MHDSVTDYSVSPASSKSMHPRDDLECFHLFNGTRRLRYRDVLHLWENDDRFADFYSSVFRKMVYKSYVWETPPVSLDTLDQFFEFTIINRSGKEHSFSPPPDLLTFKDYFAPINSDDGIVAFANIGKDATLVVPSPLRENTNYAGLAEFFSNAPIPQQISLWKVLARQIQLTLSHNKLWVSVAGGGVAWLHLRIDAKPKYYRYEAYARML